MSGYIFEPDEDGGPQIWMSVPATSSTQWSPSEIEAIAFYAKPMVDAAGLLLNDNIYISGMLGGTGNGKAAHTKRPDAPKEEE